MKSQPKRSRDVNDEMEFRALLDSAHDLIFILSADARFLYSNKALQSALGYSESELRALCIFDLLHPSCLQKCRQHFQDLMYDPRQGTLEVEFVTKDGRSITVEGNCSRGSQNGQPGAIRSIFRDVTERERAQEDLRKSEERFRSLIEHSHDAISLFGPDGAVLYVSPSTTKILGYAPEELRDRSALEFVRPDWQDAVRDRLAESVRNPGVGIPSEAYVRHKDGHWRFLEGVFTNLLHEPSVGAIVNNYRDATERKLAEEALRESELKFRILAETAASAILMYRDDRLIYANPATAAITGYTVDELIGMSLWNLVHPAFKTLIMQRRSARDRGEPIPLRNEIKFITRSGQERWVDYTVGFIPFEGMRTTIGTAFDITERRRAKEELRTSEEQLRALSARLQSAREEEGARIAREIHDELGGALTGLKWDLEGIDKVLGDGNAAGVTMVRAKIPDMTALIESTINTVRRISSELRPGVLDDLGLVAAIEWQAQQFQTRTGIKCECVADTEGLGLDPERATALFRIFQEILTNIIRHAQATRVEVALIEDGGQLELRVKDNGRGITEAELRNTRSLGLLGMQERALLVGGEVSISGRTGRGTTVIARVPVG